MCFDGTKRLCHIRGKLRKRQWINTSDIILVGLRDYQDAKADVIMKRMRSRPNHTSLKSVTVKIAMTVKPTISKKVLTCAHLDLSRIRLFAIHLLLG